MTLRTLPGRTVSALAVSGMALLASLAACTPSTETEVAAAPPETAAPETPITDIAAPTAATGPASANTSDTLSSTPPAQSTAPAVTPAPAPQAPPASGATKAELDAGSAVYARTCAMCHGPAGQGVPNMGVALTAKDVAVIKEKVTKGTVKTGDKMPPMGASMSASDLDAVAKFVAAGLPQ